MVLVTGLPSFRARSLVREILSQEPETNLVVIAGGEEMPELALFIESLAPHERARVRVLEGHPAHMDFGLSGEEYRALAADVRIVHHVAQRMYAMPDADSAARHNAATTREAIEFARACPALACLVVHSTTRIFGDASGRLYESELTRGQGFFDVVEESLARSELMVRNAEVPFVVLRPTLVSGDALTGELDPHGSLFLLLWLMLDTPSEVNVPIFGRADAPLHMVPVNYVSSAARRLARDPRARGRTFHLVDPKPPRTREAFDALLRAAGRANTKGFLPPTMARMLSRVPVVQRVVQARQGMLGALSSDADYDDRNTRELLGNDVLDVPSFTSYVEKLVRHVSQETERSKRAPEGAAAYVP